VSIINSKERTLRPFFVFPVFGLDNVENYGNTIFIVISYKTLVCVSSISSHNSISLVRAPGLLVVRNLDSCSRLQRILPGFIVFNFFMDHLISLGSGELLNLGHTGLVGNMLALRNLVLHLLLVLAKSSWIDGNRSLFEVWISGV
jgi:hypothetical protein